VLAHNLSPLDNSNVNARTCLPTRQNRLSHPRQRVRSSEPTVTPLSRRSSDANKVCSAGAGSREPYQIPYDISSEPRPSSLNIAIERSQSDRPPVLRRQTATELNLTRSPPFRRGSSPRSHETRATQRRSSVYDPIYEEHESRGIRAQLPPIDVGPSHEPVGEALAAPQYQPLPTLRPGTHPISSPRYTPYSTDRLPHEPAPPPRRRYSHTQPREYQRPITPPSGPPASTSYPPGRSPSLPSRPPPLPPSYPPDPYAPYAPAPYSRGQRRPSYEEERRPTRQEPPRYPPPVPYGSSYPPTYPYDYSGSGRGYYDPYYDYAPGRRLSQQETGEQVSHLGVPDRAYRPPIHGPTSPSGMRPQPPHSVTMPSGTPGKRRGNLPKESKDKLKLWLSMHVEHPYPTEEEKKELAAEAGMTMGQVSPPTSDYFTSTNSINVVD
jgi:hypothetical protein